MCTSVIKRVYVLVTIRHINENWEVKSVIIVIVRISYPYTGERLDDHFVEAVRDVDLSLFSDVWATTTDKASNNQSIKDQINDIFQAAFDWWAESLITSDAAECQIPVVEKPES